jgi:hypothetical protein
MENRIDYLIKDNQCAKAIDEFKILTSVPVWLAQYSDLFDSISIKPKGLPRITNSHCDGESFENIQEFAHLYSVVNSLFE